LRRDFQPRITRKQLSYDGFVGHVHFDNERYIFAARTHARCRWHRKISKYLPTQTNAVTRVSMGSFATTIEDYPYPYVIGKLCWEFPAIAPSDWEAQNVHGVNNPTTIANWEAALDATVIKQGTFTFIFHPHGWIKP